MKKRKTKKIAEIGIIKDEFLLFINIIPSLYCWKDFQDKYDTRNNYENSIRYKDVSFCLLDSLVPTIIIEMWNKNKFQSNSKENYS